MYSLRFNDTRVEFLTRLNSDEWHKLLGLCDRMQLTLLFGSLAAEMMPASISSRIDENLENNQIRFNRLQDTVMEIGGELRKRSIEFTIVKGFTHASDFVGYALLRSQGDIDLWCQGDDVFRAKDALIGLGFRAIGRSKGRHLDPLIRERSWQWTGDYYAPELPIPVDLHFKLWDEAMEHITGPPEEEVWNRRCLFTLPNGQLAHQLGLEDSLAFAALHLMMHLLHGDLRLQRAWEIGYFLQKNQDDCFWQRWQALYSEDFRRLQIVIFVLVCQWFGGSLPELIEEERRRLPEELGLWIKHYAWSPVESLFKPNKDELWLNLAFVPSTRLKWQVFTRRLLPFHGIDLSTTRTSVSSGNRTDVVAQFGQLGVRALHHIRAIPHTYWGAVQWWWISQELGPEFLLFAIASGIFDFGEFVFFLLYNVYLLQSGLHEKVLGQIAAALTFGTFAGALPAAAFMRRFGLKKGLLVAVAGTAITGVLRVTILSPPWLLCSAFLNGGSMSFWAVSLPPVVAAVTTSKNRTLAFSIVTAIGVGVGSIAGVFGGNLPKVFAKLTPTSTVFASSRNALLVGCAILTVALIPMNKLSIKTSLAPLVDGKVYPSSRFAIGFLSSLFIWSIGTGGFNPFFNVYFSHHLRVSVNALGSIFSLSQFAQVAAILFMPPVMRAMGEVKSIVILQVATGTLLGLLALATSPVTASALYVAYMSFQYASEPYLLSLLMSGVQPAERKGASALYFMVISFAGIIAAAASGDMFERVGYQPTILMCSAITLIAACMYHHFFWRKPLPAPDSHS